MPKQLIFRFSNQLGLELLDREIRLTDVWCGPHIDYGSWTLDYLSDPLSYRDPTMSLTFQLKSRRVTDIFFQKKINQRIKHL